MTEKYSTKNYKPGYSPARLQHNYKMTYESAYNLAQDLNNIFNRLYMVEQEKKEYRKETERLREALELIAKAKFYFARGEEEKQIRRVYEIAEEALKGKL